MQKDYNQIEMENKIFSAEIIDFKSQLVSNKKIIDDKCMLCIIIYNVFIN